MSEIAQQPVVSVTRSAFPWYNAYISELLSPYNESFEVAEEHDRVEGVIAPVAAGRGSHYSMMYSPR